MADIQNGTKMKQPEKKAGIQRKHEDSVTLIDVGVEFDLFEMK